MEGFFMEKIEAIGETKEILDKETQKLIEKIPIVSMRKELKKYAEYLKLKSENEIEIENYNLILHNGISSKIVKNAIDIISELLIKFGINEGRTYTIPNFKKLENKKEWDIGIIRENEKNQIFWNSEDIKSVIENNKKKVFIIINKTWNASTIKREYSNILWNLETNFETDEEKEIYINSVLEQNHVKVSPKSNFIKQLVQERPEQIEKIVIDAIIKMKKEKKKELDDDCLKEQTKKKTDKKDAKQQLDELIGIKEVKEQVQQIIDYIEINKKRKNMPMLHMVFEGNPGVGKTTVARIIGKLFAEKGVLPKDTFVEAQRADLIAKYVGQTPELTKGVIRRAMGGVLFIDEAYSLYQGEHDYGTECISTLIKEMEDHRDNICIILAGYTEEMEKMLDSNPGFQSRIQFKINFPDYSEEELTSILKFMVDKEEYKLEEGYENQVFQYFQYEKRNCEKNFGNARVARNLFDKIKFEQASRVVKEKDKKEINVIEKVDIENAISKIENRKVVKQRKIGF